MGFDRSKLSVRDRLITQARYGEITPKQAEAEAAANGLEPFERTPDLPQFDPKLESRWSIVMALAWIAWRDFKSVRKQVPEFCAESTYWVFREWNEPVNNGTEFARQKGWFLETWYRPTTFMLTLLQSHPSSEDRPARMTIREAEAALWRALSDEDLWAEGFDVQGKVTRIPSMEWTHLKLFEDGKKDVFRYDALDRSEPYTEVRFRRDDLLRIWRPDHFVAVDSDVLELGTICTTHLAPMSSSNSHVPLCTAIHWVVSQSGKANVDLRDNSAWFDGVNKLFPHISSGKVEALGRRSGDYNKPIPASAFAGIRVPHPIPVALPDLFGESSSHIRCSFFTSEDDWNSGYSDELFIQGSREPFWTHILVSRSQVLEYFPAPTPTIKDVADCKRWLIDKMRASPLKKPKSKLAFFAEAKSMFKTLPKRQFDVIWGEAIEVSKASIWGKAGAPSKSNRSTS